MDTCERTRENLSLLACGQLDSKEEAAVREHLAACPACSRYCQSMRGLCAALGAFERDAASVEPSAILHQRVKKAVLDAAQGEGTRAARFPSFLVAVFRGVQRNAWAKAAVAACVVAAAAGMYFSFRHNRDAGVACHAGPPVAASARTLPSLAAYRRAIAGTPADLDALLDKLRVYRPHEEYADTSAPPGRETPLENEKENNHG